MGLAAVVLPIVSIQAHLAVVVIFSIGAPNGFKMVHIKIHIYYQLFKHFHRQLAIVVSKRTKLLVFARFSRPQVAFAKLGLVFIRVVELFDAVMGFFTFITIAAVNSNG
jgi:hypothetical protein